MDDEVTLSQQIVWMEILLARTDTISLQEKDKIQERLNMYDRLWEDNPKIQRMRAESKAEGIAEGIAEGEVQTLRRVLVNIVSARFPELIELAQQRADKLDGPDALEMLIQQISTAPDKNVARWMLNPTVA